ncbi:MAG: PrgI family protein [Patescibacteria group bacterium]
MPQQFVVPQFIESEDTIFGPVTARQFVILMVVGLVDFLAFKLLPFVPFLIIAIPFLICGGIIAFTRINGQPFHFFILNIIQTFKKPRLRVWDKTVSDAMLRDYMKIDIPPPTVKFVRKNYAGTSRLQEISLVVNTGGVYKPEES